MFRRIPKQGPPYQGTRGSTLDLGELQPRGSRDIRIKELGPNIQHRYGCLSPESLVIMYLGPVGQPCRPDVN